MRHSKFLTLVTLLSFIFTPSISVLNADTMPSVVFSTDKTQVYAGMSSRLTWSASNFPGTVTCSQSFPGATPSTDNGGGNFIIMWPMSTTTYTIECKDDRGNDISKSLTVTFDPSIPRPQVLSMKIVPSPLTRGGTGTVTWSSKDATYCMVDGQGTNWTGRKSPTGSEQVTVTTSAQSSINFTIVCYNDVGSTSIPLGSGVVLVDANQAFAVVSSRVGQAANYDGSLVANERDFYITFNKPAKNVSAKVYKKATNTLVLDTAYPSYLYQADQTSFAVGTIGGLLPSTTYTYTLSGTDAVSGTPASASGEFTTEDLSPISPQCSLNDPWETYCSSEGTDKLISVCEASALGAKILHKGTCTAQEKQSGTLGVTMTLYHAAGVTDGGLSQDFGYKITGMTDTSKAVTKLTVMNAVTRELVPDKDVNQAQTFVANLKPSTDYHYTFDVTDPATGRKGHVEGDFYSGAGSAKNSPAPQHTPAQQSPAMTEPSQPDNSISYVTFVRFPDIVTKGKKVTLRWESDADYCTASGLWSGKKLATGSLVVTASKTGTYYIQCFNNDGTSFDKQKVSVSVVKKLPVKQPKPVIHFTADQTTITQGDSVHLSWNASSALDCEASGSDEWSGLQYAKDEQDVTPDSSQTYILKCWNREGVSATASVAIAVNPGSSQ